MFSGLSPDGQLVEFIELPPDVHPFFVGTQAHPELKSRPTRAHPLFAAFVKAAVDYAAADELPVGQDVLQRAGGFLSRGPEKLLEWNEAAQLERKAEVNGAALENMAQAVSVYDEVGAESSFLPYDLFIGGS